MLRPLSEAPDLHLERARDHVGGSRTAWRGGSMVGGEVAQWSEERWLNGGGEVAQWMEDRWLNGGGEVAQ